MQISGAEPVDSFRKGVGGQEREAGIDGTPIARVGMGHIVNERIDEENPDERKGQGVACS